MGSFYSSCFVTNMTLSHQNVARIFLVPQHLNLNDKFKYGSPMTHIFDGDDLREPDYCVAQKTVLTSDSRNLFKSKGQIVSNEGSLGMFVPFSFPIRGDYSDYGDIDFDENDRMVKAMEAFFNLSFDQISTAASDNRWYQYWYKEYLEKQKEFEAIGKCLAKIDENPPRGYTKEMNLDDQAMKNYITKMDALQDEYDTKRERYNQLDKELADMEKKNDWGFDRIPNHPDILAVLTYTDVRSEVYDFIATRPFEGWWGGQLKNNCEAYFEYAKKRDSLPEFDEKAFEGLDDELVWAMKWARTNGFKTGETRYYSLYRNAPYDFLDLFKIGEDYREDYEKLYNFIMQLGRLNKLLLPNVSGGQDTNFKLLHSLNTFTNSLLATQIEEERLEWEEDNDEDDGDNED